MQKMDFSGLQEATAVLAALPAALVCILGVVNGGYALKRDFSPVLGVLTLLLSGGSGALGAALLSSEGSIRAVGVASLAVSAFAITTSILQLTLGKTKATRERKTAFFMAPAVDGGGTTFAQIGVIGRF